MPNDQAPAPAASKVAKVSSAAVGAVGGVFSMLLSWIKALLSYIFSMKMLSHVSLISGMQHLWSAVALSARNVEIPIFYGILMCAAYVWGHHEESMNLAGLVNDQTKVAHADLIKCRNDAAATDVGYRAALKVAANCRAAAVAPAPAVIPLLAAPKEAPAPAVAPPTEASTPVPVAKAAHKKKAATHPWWWF